MAKIEGNSAVLSNGRKMPLLGLGCWQSVGNEVETAVEVALDNGYRHIDTAYNYLNEEMVGKGIEAWVQKSEKNKKEQLFVVTKLPMIGMHEGGIEKFLRLSLKKLNLAYVDLYLIHCPIGMKGNSDMDVFPIDKTGRVKIEEGTDLIAIWKEMEKMVELGLTHSIGVSNFNVRQMKKIKAIANVPMTVNQIEMNATFQQTELVDYCNANDIVVTAYAPLGSPGREKSLIKPALGSKSGIALLSNPVVQLIADKHKVSIAQVLIRYLIQMGIVTIPKSVTPSRIKSNGDVFSFTLDEVDNAALLFLEQGEEGRTFNFFKYKGIKDHPECPV